MMMMVVILIGMMIGPSTPPLGVGRDLEAVEAAEVEVVTTNHPSTMTGMVMMTIVPAHILVSSMVMTMYTTRTEVGEITKAEVMVMDGMMTTGGTKKKLMVGEKLAEEKVSRFFIIICAIK